MKENNKYFIIVIILLLSSLIFNLLSSPLSPVMLWRWQHPISRLISSFDSKLQNNTFSELWFLNNAYLNVFFIFVSCISHSMFDTWWPNVIFVGMWYIMSRLMPIYFALARYTIYQILIVCKLSVWRFYSCESCHN